MTVEREELSALAALLADPVEELVIAGEGNLSRTLEDGRMLVSPSGHRLASIAPDAWVEIDGGRLRDAVDADCTDEGWLAEILASRIDAEAFRPTVEVGLHAVIAEEVGAGYIAHTHPTALLALLCSPAVSSYAQTRLFPDHAVMLGVADCVVDYTDPGRELAVATRVAVRRHRFEHGENPRLILAVNHGIFVHGTSAREVMDRTRMAVKSARVTLAAGAVGGVRTMTPLAVDRIVGREDEHYRRQLLAADDSDPTAARP